jgi:hypothetical protein
MNTAYNLVHISDVISNEKGSFELVMYKNGEFTNINTKT